MWRQMKTWSRPALTTAAKSIASAYIAKVQAPEKVRGALKKYNELKEAEARSRERAGK